MVRVTVKPEPLTLCTRHDNSSQMGRQIITGQHAHIHTHIHTIIHTYGQFSMINVAAGFWTVGEKN